jgi:hypothetical protein
VDRSARIAASDVVPFARFAWLAGCLGTAVQPARLAVGLLAALLLWLPGIAWDRAVGPRIDPPGLLAEPWDDLERDDAQRTLRRLAVQHVPEMDFEGATIPAEDLAAALAARADSLGRDPEAERVRMAARRAAGLVPLGSFQALSAAEAEAASAIVDGALAVDVRPVAAGFRAAVIDIPVACLDRDPVFAVAFGAWAVLALLVTGGAFARMEGSQVAGRGVLSARDALTFAADRWTALVLAWVGPVGIAAAVGVLCYAWGFLFRSDAGSWIGAALYALPLVVGAIAGLALVIACIGAPLAPAAIACDGLDALDASQRGAVYFLARPLLWVLTLLAMMGVVAIGLVILRVFGWALTAYPAALVDLGAGGAAPVHSVPLSPARWAIPLEPRSALVWSWVLLVGVVLTGASISLVAGALTRSYLLLREACDGQPVDSTWPFEVPLDATDVAPSASAAPAA